MKGKEAETKGVARNLGNIPLGSHKNPKEAQPKKCQKVPISPTLEASPIECFQRKPGSPDLDGCDKDGLYTWKQCDRNMSMSKLS